MSSRTGQVANGKGKEGGEAMNEAGYQTLIVKFSEPITALDGIFDDAEAWGVDTLKGRVFKNRIKIWYKKWCYIGVSKLLTFNTLTYKIALCKFA